MTSGEIEPLDSSAALPSLREPVLAVSDAGTITFANRRFLEVTRFSRPTVVGGDAALLEEYVIDGYDTLRDAIDAVADGRVEERRADCEVRHPESAPVPREIPVEIRVSPVRDRESEVLLVIRNVDDRVAYERALERRNDRLDDFASVISHDLRNPLNVATGRLQFLSEECDSEHIEDVAAALDRMDVLIDDLLTLARDGECAAEWSPVNLRDVTRRSWRTIETADASLRVDSDAQLRVDEGRFRQLLSNLLRNAVEHGGDDVTVRVGATDDGFYVGDDGEGIPAAERGRVLEPGYTLSENGTGLGLNIVADVADAHDWKLRVSESEDGGARFEFEGVEFAGS